MSNKYLDKFRIKSTRLPGYNYGQNGSYFVTICTKNREPFFGEIVETHENATPQKARVENVETYENASPLNIDTDHWSVSGTAYKEFMEKLESIVRKSHIHASLRCNPPYSSETHVHASLQPTTIGEHAIKNWFDIPKHYPFVRLDEFTLMPDHLHGILHIEKPVNDPDNEKKYLPFIKYKNRFGPQSRNLSAIIRSYKGSIQAFATTNKIKFAWQSRFHDHIIRDKNNLDLIRQYIRANPDNWRFEKGNEEGIFR